MGNVAKSFFLLLSTFILILPAYAAPKKVPTAKPGNCKGCHGTNRTLPSAHPDTKDMNYEGCLGCHAHTGADGLRGKLPSAHIHRLSGVTCAKCHGKAGKREAVEMKECTACHKVEKLAEKTAKVKPANPHASPHHGADLDCNVCHHQHRRSEDFCSQCHKFDFTVP